MLDLITANDSPISVTIDGVEKKFALFTMSDWGELLRRLKRRKLMELRKAVEIVPVPPEVLATMLSDVNDHTYDVRDGLQYSTTIDGTVDILHISSRDIDRRVFENLQSNADSDQISYLIFQILAVAPADEIDKTVKKKHPEKLSIRTISPSILGFCQGFVASIGRAILRTVRWLGICGRSTK